MWNSCLFVTDVKPYVWEFKIKNKDLFKGNIFILKWFILFRKKLKQFNNLYFETNCGNIL